MKRTLEKLWNGNIAPWECCGTKDPEIENLIELIEKNKASLSNDLGQQQTATLQKYCDCYDEYSYLITVHAFCDGFSLACKLLTEALSEDTH